MQNHRSHNTALLRCIMGPNVDLCGPNVAVIKEFNLRQHFETKHKDKLEKTECRAEATERI